MADLNLKLRIEAIDRVSATLEQIVRNSAKTNKILEEQARHYANREKREIEESQRRAEKHAYWKQGIAARETRALEREAEKRKKITEKEILNQQRLREKTLSDFRSDAQKMALSTTAPATIIGVLGARAFMAMEQRQIKLQMYFGENAKMMEKFVTDYAKDTAFSVENAVSLLEGIALGKETLGLKSDNQIKDLSKVVGDVILAYAPSREQQTGVMTQLKQILTTGRTESLDLKIMSSWGLNIDRLAKIVGMQKKGKTWTADEIMKIFTLAQQTNEVQTKIAANAKSFSQAYGTAAEATTMIQEGLGKVLVEQFKLTGLAKGYGDIMQKISEELKSDGSNMTKGMVAYLAMLALTVAPMLVLISQWGRIKTLIIGSNVQAGVFKSRMIAVSGVMSGLYLISKDWKGVLKDIEEDPLQGIINNLDTIVALGVALKATFDALNNALLLTNTRLVALAKSPVLRAAGLAFKIYDMVNISDEQVEKNLNKARNGGITPPSNANGSNGFSTANSSSLNILANLNQRPKVEVINNIKVDSQGQVKVDTKTKEDGYQSPYSKPKHIQANDFGE
jgi:hypothetical protein